MTRFSILAVAVAALPLASGCCCCGGWTAPTPTYAAAPVAAPAPACEDPCNTCPAPPVTYGYSPENCAPSSSAPAYGTTPYTTP